MQETLTSVPRRSGIPPGLDLQTANTGPGGSWFEPNTRVGHRIVWGKDELPPGTPSMFAISTNTLSTKGFLNLDLTSSTPTIRVTYTSHGFSSGNVVKIVADLVATGIVTGSYVITFVDSNNFTFTNPGFAAFSSTLQVGKLYDVQLTSTIPGDVVAGWWWEAYRSTATANLNSDPFDDCQLVTHQVVTSTDISNGYIQWTDTVSDAQRGVQLYTNEGAEGLDLANDRPPFAKHIAHFRGHAFYFGTYREHFRSLDMQNTDLITDDTGSITITSGGSPFTYTAAATEDVALKKFQRFTEAVEGTMSVAVRKTAQSLCKIINRDASAPFYAFYISGVADDPGRMVIERSDLLDIEFSIVRSAGIAAGAFVEDPPTSGTTFVSDNESFSNRAARSKFQKSESVPEQKTNSIGRKGFDVLGVVTLKDSLMVCKEDGVFEVTGETDGLAGENFVVREIDPELILIAPETLVALDNVAFGWFNAGIMRVSSAQAAIISDDIFDLLEDAKRMTNFKTATFGVSYSSEQKYQLWIPEIGSTPYATLGYVYDFLENSWLGPWKKKVTCGFVLSPRSEVDLLYMGHAIDNYALSERKDYTEDDYQDEAIAVTVTAFGTTALNGVTVATATVSYSYSETLDEGWLFQQGNFRANVEAVSGLGGGSFLLTLSSNITVATGAANLSLPIELLIHWADDVAGNVAQQKDYVEAQIYMSDSSALHHYVGFVSDEIGTETWLPRITQTQSGGWGSSWGTIWGDPLPNFSTPVRAPIPREHRRARALRVLYRHRWAREPVNIIQMALSVNTISEMTTLSPR